MLWPFRLAHQPVVQKPFFEMTVFEHPKWRLDDVSLAASAGSSSSNDPFVSLYLFPSNSFDEKQSPSLPLAVLAFHVDDGGIHGFHSLFPVFLIICLMGCLHYPLRCFTILSSLR